MPPTSNRAALFTGKKSYSLSLLKSRALTIPIHIGIVTEISSCRASGAYKNPSHTERA
ncbi:MAG: hypothetical protein ACE5R6_17195 [Candidatus Heimdallarchaeota archaeon]